MSHHAAFALQDLLVLLILGLAVAYVVRRLTRAAKGHADCGCGHGDGCASGDKKAAAVEPENS